MGVYAAYNGSSVLKCRDNVSVPSSKPKLEDGTDTFPKVRCRNNIIHCKNPKRGQVSFNLRQKPEITYK